MIIFLDDSLKRRLPKDFIPFKMVVSYLSFGDFNQDDLWSSFDKLNQFYTDSLFGV